ncbi:sugar nucleotide-binding protein [Candidatus Pelagibacter sp. Uisw_094]|uniref:sugar nucleotide-binding protein n=1 Tax=Candidatus Pelagibacter sp. Uisw_094 TaxID=3230980 RepID=UPI0039EA7F41|tara:strand:+ start:316 stop:1209 length:894 start_codon:yes stop_codon:yes gene_type:complete
MRDKKKIIILGSTGMLGSEVLKVFLDSKRYKIFASIRNQKQKKNFKLNNLNEITFFKFDARIDNVEKLKKYITKNTIIINCIGIIKPQINETKQDSVYNAIKINSAFPHQLHKRFEKNKIYQIATDCVYSGKKGLYNENDIHDAEDIYGKSKSLGEVNSKNFYNIRTSIIGKELNSIKSLYEWFLSQKEKSKLNGFKNHSWNGLTTNAFAKVIISIIQNKIYLPPNIHVMPNDIINKYEMLNIFKKKTKKNINIKSITAEKRINRTLSTMYPSIVKKIWLGTEYKRVPNLKDLILEF